jgi:hypothetical protein
MIDPSFLLQIVYTHPSFFSINYWAWPIMYMGIGLGLFTTPAMAIGCNFDDIVIIGMLGLNFGVLLGIISSITPFFMLIVTLIPLFLYMVLE